MQRDQAQLKKLAAFVLTGDSSVLEELKPGLASKESLSKSSTPFPWMRAGGIALGAAAVGLTIAAIVENGRVASAKNEAMNLTAGHPSPIPPQLADQADDAVRRFNSAKQLVSFRHGCVAGPLACTVPTPAAVWPGSHS